MPDNSEAFQSQAFSAEQQNQWPQDWLNLAKNRKLFHLAVPQKYGGHQLSVPALIKEFERASYLDGSFGWTLTLGAGAGIFAAFMHPQFAKEQFSKPETFITGSGYPAGTAKVTEKGFIGNGKWKYATGSPHATLFTASCVLDNELNTFAKDQPVKVLTLYPEEVQIESSWNSYGLKATANRDFEIENVIVPAERTFTLDPNDLMIDEPLYRFPFQAFAECTLAASLAGIARHFMSEAAILLHSKSNHTDELEQKLEQSTKAIDSAWQILLNHTGDAWKSCGQAKEVNKEQQNSIAKAAKNMAKVALTAAQEMCPYCGMSILEENSIANRAWRDLHTASQHMLLTPFVK